MESQGGQRAWKNILLLGASQLVTMVLALVLKIYLPRVLGLEKSGQVFFAESLILIYFSFLPLGIGIYVFREVPKNPENARNLVRPILLVEGILFLLVTGAMLLQLVFQDKDPATITFVLVLALSSFFGLLCFQIFRPIFLCLQQVSFVAMIDSLSKVLLALILVVGLSLSNSLYVLAWGSVLAMLITLVIYMHRLYRQGLWGGSLNRKFVKDTIIRPLPFFVHGALIAIYMNMDVTILGLIADARETGLYGAAFRLIGIFLLFVPLLSSSLMPVLSRLLAQDKDSYRHMLEEIMRVILALAGLLVFPLVLFAEELIAILYGVEFAKSAGAVRLLGPTLILSYCNVILAQHLSLTSRGHGLIAVTICSIGLDVVLNKVFIPWGLHQWGAGGGAMGVALTNVGSEVLVFVAFSFLSGAYLKTWALMRRLLLLLAPLLLLIAAMQGLILSLSVKALLGFLLLPLYLILFGYFRLEDWRMMEGIFKRLREKVQQRWKSPPST